MFESVGSFFHFLHQDCVSQIRLDYRAFSRILSLTPTVAESEGCIFEFHAKPQISKDMCGLSSEPRRGNGHNATDATPREMRIVVDIVLSRVSRIRTNGCQPRARLSLGYKSKSNPRSLPCPPCRQAPKDKLRDGQLLDSSPVGEFKKRQRPLEYTCWLALPLTKTADRLQNK